MNVLVMQEKSESTVNLMIHVIQIHVKIMVFVVMMKTTLRNAIALSNSLAYFASQRIRAIQTLVTVAHAE
jgi:hypothetical protein